VREIVVPGPICSSCGLEIEKPNDAHMESFRQGIYVHDRSECLDRLAQLLNDETFWGIFGHGNG
jgi:hypothetical protein